MKKALFIFSLLFALSLFSIAWANPAGEIQEFQPKTIFNFGIQGTKQLALTFDDGPHPKATEAVLEVLREFGIRAAFFTIGQNVKQYPKLAEKIIQDGHLLANHTYSHANLSKDSFLDIEKLIPEILEAHTVLAPSLSSSQRWYFRAPGGGWEEQHAKNLNAHPILKKYIGPVYWDIGGDLVKSWFKVEKSADWKCWADNMSPERCARGYMNEISQKQGGVVLMHDLNIKTAKMLKIMLPQLIEQGYQFISLDDIRELDQYIKESQTKSFPE